MAQKVEHGSACAGYDSTGAAPSQNVAAPSFQVFLFREGGAACDRVREAGSQRSRVWSAARSFSPLRIWSLATHSHSIIRALRSLAGLGERVVNPRSVATAGYEARVFQRSQMAGDLGLTQAQNIHNLADTNLTLPEEIEDPEPRNIGQGFEDGCGFRHRYNPLFTDLRVLSRVVIFIGGFSDEIQSYLPQLRIPAGSRTTEVLSRKESPDDCRNCSRTRNRQTVGPCTRGWLVEQAGRNWTSGDRCV